MPPTIRGKVTRAAIRSAGRTDEHKRQKEYWRRAARDAGLSVSEEVFVRGAGTMDVVITGDG